MAFPIFRFLISTADHDEGAVVPVNKITGDIDFLVSRKVIEPVIVGGIQMQAQELETKFASPKPERDEITVEDYVSAAAHANNLQTQLTIQQRREEILLAEIASRDALIDRFKTQPQDEAKPDEAKPDENQLPSAPPLITEEKPKPKRK